jgi:hypothetical protein
MNIPEQKTSLLVEDETFIALNEKMTLEKYGYSVIIATSGEKAGGNISVIAREINKRIIIIIGDDGIGMPESVGIESSTGFGLMLVGILMRHLNGEMARHSYWSSKNEYGGTKDHPPC